MWVPRGCRELLFDSSVSAVSLHSSNSEVHNSFLYWLIIIQSATGLQVLECCSCATMIKRHKQPLLGATWKCRLPVGRTVSKNSRKVRRTGALSIRAWMTLECHHNIAAMPLRWYELGSLELEAQCTTVINSEAIPMNFGRAGARESCLRVHHAVHVIMCGNKWL